MRAPFRSTVSAGRLCWRFARYPTLFPAAGELLVRTTASSINPVDVKTRSRVYGPGIPPLPMMLGWDLADMVADRGTTVLRPGQRVIAMSPQLAAGAGTWADLVALPAALLPRHRPR